MFENDLAQARSLVRRAQRLQACPRRVKVFDQLLLRRWIKWLYPLWCFHAEQARGNDPGWHQTPKQWQVLRRLRERVLEGVDNVLFNQREMMDNFGNAPFVLRRAPCKALVVDLNDEIEKSAVSRV